MEKQIEVITIIVQQEERTLTRIKTVAQVDEKNGTIFIRYIEKAGNIPVLIKWNKKHLITLVRKSIPVNRFMFESKKMQPLLYATTAGEVPLVVKTDEVQGKFSNKNELESLEWTYQLLDDQEIVGEYKVKLHLY